MLRQGSSLVIITRGCYAVDASAGPTPWGMTLENWEPARKCAEIRRCLPPVPELGLRSFLEVVPQKTVATSPPRYVYMCQPHSAGHWRRYFTWSATSMSVISQHAWQTARARTLPKPSETPHAGPKLWLAILYNLQTLLCREGWPVAAHRVPRTVWMSICGSRQACKMKGHRVFGWQKPLPQPMWVRLWRRVVFLAFIAFLAAPQAP